MSLKKEEIIWLMETYGNRKPNCGCGKDPCETYGAQDEDSNMTITGRPDHEVEMAHKQLRRTADYAGQLQAIMKDMPEVNLPAWVQSKITSASDYISKVYHYLEDYLSQMAHEKGMMDGEAEAMKMLQGQIVAVNEEMEGEIAKAKHEIEIELNISKSDMKKLHDGGKVTLKDTTGSNKFTVTVSAS